MSRDGRQHCAVFRGDHAKREGCRVEPAGALARRIAVDQTFVQHVKRDPGRGARRAFAVTSLKQEQDALFDRELEVLHVAEVLFRAC